MSVSLPRPPAAGQPISASWGQQVVDYLRSLTPALRNQGVIVNRTASGTSFRADAGKGGGTVAAAETHPWQPYPAPYIGSGAPPAGQGRKIMLRQGFVSDGINLWVPARKNFVFTVPPNCTEGYYVWLVFNLSEDGQIIALDYDSGTDLPAALSFDPDTDDTLPTVAYDLLLVITSTADSVELASAVSMRRGPLRLEIGDGNFGPRVGFVETSL